MELNNLLTDNNVDTITADIFNCMYIMQIFDAYVCHFTQFKKRQVEIKLRKNSLGKNATGKRVPQKNSPLGETKVIFVIYRHDIFYLLIDLFRPVHTSILYNIIPNLTYTVSIHCLRYYISECTGFSALITVCKCKLEKV